MKITITHLKAPWPEGAKVGDVVEFAGDKVPDWAVGKCKPAAEDAGVTAGAPPASTSQLSEEDAKAAAALAEAEKQAAEERAAAEAKAAASKTKKS